METRELHCRGKPPETSKSYIENTTTMNNHRNGPKLPDEYAPKKQTTTRHHCSTDTLQFPRRRLQEGERRRSADDVHEGTRDFALAEEW
jgi:hypothetical protein